MSQNEHKAPQGAAVCAQVRELLAAAVDAPLSPQERTHVATHLAGCAPCRTVASWMETIGTTAAHSPAPAAPTAQWLAQLKARVMDQVRAEGTPAGAAAPRAVDDLDERVERVRRPGREPAWRGMWPAWPEFMRSPRVLATLAAVTLIGIFTYAEIRDRASLSRAPQRTPQLVADKLEDTAPKLLPTPESSAQGRIEGLDQAAQTQVAPAAEGGLAAATSAAPSNAPTPPTAGARQEFAAELRSVSQPVPPTQALAKGEWAPGQGLPAGRAPQSAATPTVAAAGGSGAVAPHQTPAEPPAALTAPPIDEEAAARLAAREPEVEASAGDPSIAPRWDEEQVRGALALVLEAQEPRTVEAAVGELMLALEASPRPSKGFVRAARRVQLAPPAPSLAPTASSGAARSAEPLRDSLGLAAKDKASALAPTRGSPRPNSPLPAAIERWSELPAASAASSLTDSATVALLARLPQLPEGQVRERALLWLQRRGIR